MTTLCIHRGARQIGGTCVEMTCSRNRLVLDLGLPLDSAFDDTPLPNVPGLDAASDDLLGILISHPHQDHYGLAAKAHEDIPVIMGAGARRILEAARFFFTDTPSFRRSVVLEDRRPVRLGPFTVTPYLADHSAYDAYALQIDAGGRRIFYSGDFRAHGRKGRLFERLIQSPPPDIDVLLMEGSTIGRTGIDAVYPTEDQLEAAFQRRFESATGVSLVWTSAQNIDRLVTLYRACRHTGKKFVADLYTAHILQSIGNGRLPQPGWRDFYVYVPQRFRIMIKERGLFDYIRRFAGCRVYPERLARWGAEAVMLFRPSMAWELDRFGCLDNAQLIYSLWSGYLREERLTWFKPWLDERGIPLHHRHTSGHAAVADLQRFAAALNPRALVPIHSFEPEAYPDLFDNVEPHGDGERWTI